MDKSHRAGGNLGCKINDVIKGKLRWCAHDFIAEEFLNAQVFTVIDFAVH